MAYRLIGQRATHLALLLGSTFLPLAAPATGLATVVIEAPLVLPPELILAKHWQAGLAPSDFLVSEKLDGVRAVWDGQVLRFRSGRRIIAPDWFIAALPATPLDGELWLQRGRFDELSGTVRHLVPVDADWRKLHYMIFDLPGEPGSFAERSARVVALVAATGVPWLQAVEHRPGSDRATLQSQLRQLVSEGGEGFMLHRADADWSPGRSDALRKLKLVPDEDARVVSHLPGKGRNAGRLGALLLEMPNGKRFALGTGFTDAQRESPPAVGTFVTYRYRGRTTTGLPRFASFMRQRSAE